MLGHQHVGQQARRRNSLVNDLGGNRGLCQRTAVAARPLAAHMVLHGEHARRVVQLLADVLAHALQRAAAGTGRGVGLVTDLDARQLLRQRRALGLGLFLVAGRCRRLQVFELGLQRRNVRVHRLVEQRLLLRIELLAPGAELHAPQVRDLIGQLLEFGIAPIDLMRVTLDTSEQPGGQLTQLALAQGGQLFGSDLRSVEHGGQCRALCAPAPSADSLIATALYGSPGFTRRG